ncbi:MurR/RpiR family transcriptional regulator, partial [Salinispira pacifica]
MEQGERNPAVVDSALFAIRASADSLSEAEEKVASFVLADPRQALHFNVAELARRSGVSKAAVVRFCRRIGADSFSEFKLRLARDVFRSSDDRFLPDLELESNTSAATVVKGVIGSAERSLARLEQMLEVRELESAAEAVCGASVTYLYGIAASGLVAYDLYQKLLRIGLPAVFSSDTDVQITSACNLRPEDVAFVVSYSGETAAMVKV